MPKTYDDIAALITSRIPRPSPITGGVIVADLGLTNDTPAVTVLTGGATRRAIYLPPHAVQVGNVFVGRAGPALTDPLICWASNYQVPVAAGGGGGDGWGSTPGVAPASAAPSDDWAAAMTDPNNDDGALLPLILGQVPQ